MEKDSKFDKKRKLVNSVNKVQRKDISFANKKRNMIINTQIIIMKRKIFMKEVNIGRREEKNKNLNLNLKKKKKRIRQGRAAGEHERKTEQLHHKGGKKKGVETEYKQRREEKGGREKERDTKIEEEERSRRNRERKRRERETGEREDFFRDTEKGE